MSDTRIIRTISAILLSAMFLAGCQEAEQRPAEEVVQERAQARWDQLIDQQYAKAWEYFAPGYRETSPVEQYIASMSAVPSAGRWPMCCRPTARRPVARCDRGATYSLPRASAGLDTVKPTRPVSETWIFSRGQWWFTPGN